jgi:hypothetical protein
MMASRSCALKASAIAFNVATETDCCLAMPADMWMRSNVELTCELRGAKRRRSEETSYEKVDTHWLAAQCFKLRGCSVPER